MSASRGNLAASSIGFASALIVVAGLQAMPGGHYTAPNVVSDAIASDMSFDKSTPDDAPFVADDLSAPGNEPVTPMTAVQQEEATDKGRSVAVSVSVEVPAAPAAPRCQALAEELWDREEAGEILYEDYVELSEEEYENATLNLSMPRTDIAPRGSRPSYASFGDSYDVADIPSDRLDEVVGRCWELGLID